MSGALRAALRSGGGPAHRAALAVLARQQAEAELRYRSRPLPPPGQGLNQPALLTFRRMRLAARGGGGGLPANGSSAHHQLLDAFRGRLQEASQKLGGVFVHYDSEQGVWMLKLDAWP